MPAISIRGGQFARIGKPKNPDKVFELSIVHTCVTSAHTQMPILQQIRRAGTQFFIFVDTKKRVRVSSEPSL